MDFELVKTWLENQNKKNISKRWMLAALGLVLLPIGTATGALLIYGLLRVITHESEDPQIGTKCIWITLGIVLMMFVVNLLIPRKKKDEKFYHEDSGDDSLAGSYVNRKKVQAQFILWIILTGPRLLSWSLFSFAEIRRLKQQDLHSCAALLWLMMNKRSKVPYETIPQELDWLDVEATLAQLKFVPGVLFLKTPPAGVSLTDDLRKAIRTGAPV
jgi:hypothetical protein